ncbi:MAG: hypothetical protein AAF709_11120 [Pseudomonadota bacterium]
MRVAFSQHWRDGPWGGGNNFVRSLISGLEASGHEVTHELSEGVDLALIVDPRARNPLVTFTLGELLRHLLRHPNTLVVHRINECDERKGTRSMNMRLRLANYAADHTVFIASWLQALKVWRVGKPSSVILNGADANVFHAEGSVTWDGSQPLRIVTHHWGANRMKGFDTYDVIDELLDQPGWREKIQFTYVGNLPDELAFRNIRHVAPLSGPPLANELRSHHAYLTASINEPAGMHHIEGAMCGLPLIYRQSGALPEYCAGFGEAFEGPDDVADALNAMLTNYAETKPKMNGYPHTSERMVSEYIALFENLEANRAEILDKRKLWRDPLAFALNQLPL